METGLRSAEMCRTIAVYPRLPQLRWERLQWEGRLVEKFPWHWHGRLVQTRIRISCCSGSASHHAAPVRVLQTHDDRQGDGLVLTGLHRGRWNGDTGDDWLHGVRGKCWGRHVWSHFQAHVAGK